MTKVPAILIDESRWRSPHAMLCTDMVSVAGRRSHVARRIQGTRMGPSALGGTRRSCRNGPMDQKRRMPFIDAQTKVRAVTVYLFGADRRLRSVLTARGTLAAIGEPEQLGRSPEI